MITTRERRDEPSYVHQHNAPGTHMATENGKSGKPSQAFDYSALDHAIAEQARSAATKIRGAVQSCVAGVIAVGRVLIAMKESLPHGCFGQWARSEFNWSERTTRHFRAVAERFGNVERIAELKIEPTAAYLLAAPAVPDEARHIAITRAIDGESITPATAKEIVARYRKKVKRRPRTPSGDKLNEQILRVLARYRDRCNPRDFADLARTLRQFADELQNGGNDINWPGG
jgi:hypothetical protein